MTNTVTADAPASDAARHSKGPRLPRMSRRKAKRLAVTAARRHNRGLRATGGKPR